MSRFQSDAGTEVSGASLRPGGLLAARPWRVVMTIDVLTVRSPIALALLATCSWGLWAVFTKLATRSGRPLTVLLVSYLVAIALGAAVFLATGPGVEISTRDLGYAVAGGGATGVGSLLYYAALDTGDTGRISTVVGLYFVVVVALGVVVLDEPITARKAVGVGFGMAAVLLLAS